MSKRGNAGSVGLLKATTSSAAGGIFTVAEAQQLKGAGLWPGLPTYTLSRSTGSVNEGSAVTFTMTTTGIADGVQLPWTASGVTLSDLTSGSLSGNFTIANNTASVTFNIASDQTTEGNETITLTSMGQTISSTVNDTSLSAQDIQYLIVAGGGGGGATGGGSGGGGGGAGGLLTNTQTLSQGTVLTITVGGGGNPSSQGGNSSIIGTGISQTAIGGGYGGSGNGATGGTGGSGGGGSAIGGSGGSGTAGQGYKGGNVGSLNQGDNGSAGGGGAGGAGADASWTNTGSGGGPGVASSITGTSVTYARGGDGGNGSYWNNGVGTSGGANTGDGGRGGGNGNSGGYGGSGVVILRVLTSGYSGTHTGSPTVTTDGSYKVIKFTGSGSYTV